MVEDLVDLDGIAAQLEVIRTASLLTRQPVALLLKLQQLCGRGTESLAWFCVTS
jgi:hypothetical protein